MPFWTTGSSSESWSSTSPEIWGFADAGVLGIRPDFTRGIRALGQAHPARHRVIRIIHRVNQGHGVVIKLLRVCWVGHEAHQESAFGMQANLDVGKNAGGPAVRQLSVGESLVIQAEPV